jgi:type II secretory pathway component PulM
MKRGVIANKLNILALGFLVQLMTLLEESAKQQQLSVSKMLETGKNKFSVTLSEVAFNAVLRWIDLLQTQYHLTIAQLSIEAIKNGRANAVVVIDYAIQ